MDTYTLVYRPTDRILDELQEMGDVSTTWNTNNDTEYLFTIGYETAKEIMMGGDKHDVIQNELQRHYPDRSVVSFVNAPQNDDKEAIQTGKSLNEKITFSDFIPNHDGLTDVLRDASPGGDARKYCSFKQYRRFAIRFDHRRSSDVLITGFEPLRRQHVEQLVELGYMNDEMPRETPRRYPRTGQMLEWADRVQEEWGLECGFVGDFTVTTDGEVKIGFDGFTIHNADKQVKQWCDEHWGDPKQIESTKNNVSHPFMYPSEHNFYTADETIYPDPVIRLWWD